MPFIRRFQDKRSSYFTRQDILDQVKHIHFVGIGGSGMCPLTEILHHEGFELTRSDVDESDALDRIHSYGIPVSTGHKVENTGDAQPLIHTAAVKHDDPELITAEEHGILAVERSVMLGIVTYRYENSIAVSGTRSKTTTTTMITQVYVDGGVDPLAIIGGRLPAVGGNGRVGKSQTIIYEACEYADTFLQLTPAISVILNIDADHLDYPGTLGNIIKPFHQSSLQTSHLLVINDDDPNRRKTVEGIQNARIITSGMNPDNDYAAGRIPDLPKVCESFPVYKYGEKLSDVTLSVPGKHNIMNALIAVAVSDYLGIDPKTAAEDPGRFTGTRRRLEILGKFSGVTVADDFAHHSTKLVATLAATSRTRFRAVWTLFQSHAHSRTYLLFDDLIKTLSIPKYAVLSPIPTVREASTYRIYFKDFAEKIPDSVCLSFFEEMTDYAMSHAQSGDLILALGGGDIYKYVNLIVEECQKKDFLLKT